MPPKLKAKFNFKSDKKNKKSIFDDFEYQRPAKIENSGMVKLERSASNNEVIKVSEFTQQ